MARIGVIGSGTMGQGIAQVFAMSGYEVLMTDVTAEVTDRGVRKIGERLQREVEKGKISAEAREKTIGLIKATYSYEDLSGCELIVEAVYENCETKKDVLKRISGINKGSMIATNTSSIPVTTLSASVTEPERFLGMHFFNPVPAMKLVELIAGEFTSEETLGRAKSITEHIGKTPVMVRDSPGFIVNRILIPEINEACFLLFEGVATTEDVDNAMKLGANHPMGPLELGDLIGLDVCLNIMDMLYSETGDPKYRPCPLLKRMVAAGKLGRKSGRGFYKY
jgi:3-hydroxybutyryl-CoA dehydrogenase